MTNLTKNNNDNIITVTTEKLNQSNDDNDDKTTETETLNTNVGESCADLLNRRVRFLLDVKESAIPDHIITCATKEEDLAETSENQNYVNEECLWYSCDDLDRFRKEAKQDTLNNIIAHFSGSSSNSETKAKNSSVDDMNDADREEIYQNMLSMNMKKDDTSNTSSTDNPDSDAATRATTTKKSHYTFHHVRANYLARRRHRLKSRILILEVQRLLKEQQKQALQQQQSQSSEASQSTTQNNVFSMNLAVVSLRLSRQSRELALWIGKMDAVEAGMKFKAVTSSTTAREKIKTVGEKRTRTEHSEQDVKEVHTKRARTLPTPLTTTTTTTAIQQSPLLNPTSVVSTATHQKEMVCPS